MMKSFLQNQLPPKAEFGSFVVFCDLFSLLYYRRAAGLWVLSVVIAVSYVLCCTYLLFLLVVI